MTLSKYALVSLSNSGFFTALFFIFSLLCFVSLFPLVVSLVVVVVVSLMSSPCFSNHTPIYSVGFSGFMVAISVNACVMSGVRWWSR